MEPPPPKCLQGQVGAWKNKIGQVGEPNHPLPIQHRKISFIPQRNKFSPICLEIVSCLDLSFTSLLLVETLVKGNTSPP